MMKVNTKDKGWASCTPASPRRECRITREGMKSKPLLRQEAKLASSF